MLRGINIIGFSENLSSLRFDDADVKDYIATFSNEKSPSFILVVDVSANHADIHLINKITGETVNEDNNFAITGGVDTKIITYPGLTEQDFDDGYYYYKITIGTKTIYSEVFELSSCTDDLIKFVIESSDLTLASIYVLSFSTIPVEFYLRYENSDILAEINEEGSEKTYGDIPAFNTMTISHKVNIFSNTDIYKFLSCLRIFEVNGNITITIDGYEFKAYNFSNEKKDATDDSTIISALSFKEFDYISSRNAI